MPDRYASDRRPPLLFALDTPGPEEATPPNAPTALGPRIADALGLGLAPVGVDAFADGEHRTRPLADVEGRDVYVLHALYGDDGAPGDAALGAGPQSVNDKLCRLLFFLGAVRDAGAGRLTAVVPYLCYARADRKTEPRDPVITRYVAHLVEAVGTDRIVTLDVHSRMAYHNAFHRCRAVHLEGRALFARHLAPRLRGEAPPVVVSPDIGGTKRAERLRRLLAQEMGVEPATAFVEKWRHGGETRGGTLVGEVKGRPVVIVDDMIATGGTMRRAAEVCRAAGASAVHAVATHGLFLPGAEALVTSDALDAVAVTNTVPPFRLPEAARARVEMLDAAPVFAEALRCLHAGAPLPEVHAA
jgi:ribose-phosphate pyrophosphokinase